MKVLTRIVSSEADPREIKQEKKHAQAASTNLRMVLNSSIPAHLTEFSNLFGCWGVICSLPACALRGFVGPGCAGILKCSSTFSLVVSQTHTRHNNKSLTKNGVREFRAMKLGSRGSKSASSLGIDSDDTISSTQEVVFVFRVPFAEV
jgi:hypothetical protein